MEVAQTNRSFTAGRTKSFQRNENHNRASRKSSSQIAQQCSFLTTTFDDLPIFDIAPAMLNCLSIEDGGHLIVGGYDIDLTENLKTLRKCAESYCKVNNGILPEPCINPIKELQMLYQAICKCCPSDSEIEINYVDERNELVFLELIPAPYPQCSLAFLSVKFVEYLPPLHRKFFVSLLSLIRVTIGIQFPEDHFDFAYVIGVFEDEMIEDDISEDSEYSDYVTSYREGQARLLFDEILRSPWHQLDTTTSELSEYLLELVNASTSPELTRLIEIAAEGLDIMHGDSIGNYRFNLSQCNIQEFDCVSDNFDETFGFDRLTAFCYGDEDDDPVTSRAVDCINDYAGNYIQEDLYEPHVITPEYDAPFKCSNFPDRWFKWYIKFNEARIKYEQAVTTNVGIVQTQNGDSCI